MNSSGHKSSEPFGRIGSLETRLAASPDEIRQAQRLRYQVFYQEMSAKQSLRVRFTRRDHDRHDRVCDHLLVLENNTGKAPLPGEAPLIVGTQRFFVRSGKSGDPGFHSQNEFDLEGLQATHPGKRFMELGRSCILPGYRNRRTAELMWQGTWAYALKEGVDVMTGCASFEAADVDAIAPALGFLSIKSPASGAWQVRATSPSALPLAEFESRAADPKKAMRLLPPLIRGYLRLGAMFSSHAVPDPAFGTIDVLVILPLERINPRYVNYYGSQAERHRV